MGPNSFRVEMMLNHDGNTNQSRERRRDSERVWQMLFAQWLAMICCGEVLLNIVELVGMRRRRVSVCGWVGPGPPICETADCVVSVVDPDHRMNSVLCASLHRTRVVTGRRNVMDHSRRGFSRRPAADVGGSVGAVDRHPVERCVSFIRSASISPRHSATVDDKSTPIIHRSVLNSDGSVARRLAVRSRSPP